MKARKAILAGRLLSQPGDSQPEIDQLKKIYELMGTPTGTALEELKILPNWEKMQFTTQYETKLRNAFRSLYDDKAIDLLECLLDLNPKTRISSSKSLLFLYYFLVLF
jgi:serine/threonine protein kinase